MPDRSLAIPGSAFVILPLKIAKSLYSVFKSSLKAQSTKVLLLKPRIDTNLLGAALPPCVLSALSGESPVVK